MTQTENVAESGISPATAAAGGAIGTAALIIMLGNLSSSILGFVRQFVIAGVFGATHATDAFYAAALLPQMFYDLTIGAAVSAALIPTFTQIVQTRGREELWNTFGGVIVLAWIVLAVVVGALVAAARPVMQVLLLGYQHRHLAAATFDLAEGIARILVPTLLFLGTSAVLLSVLYALRRFRAPAFASGLYHVGVICGALLLARPLGILALPVGALAGSAAQAAVQIPPLVRAGFDFRPRLTFTPEIRKIILLYAPVAAGLVISLVGQVIDIGFKSELEKGTITEMLYATTLTQFPIGIAVAALGFAILPTISADAVLGRTAEFKTTLSAGIRLVLFLTIPAAAGYLALATPIVGLLFQHGHLDQHEANRVSLALVGYAIQIPFVGVDQLLIMAFYARKNTLTPMLVGVAGVGIYVISALLLMPRLNLLGLALANTIQNSLHAAILVVLLVASIGAFHSRALMVSAGKSLAASIVSAIAAAGLALLIAHSVPGRGLAERGLAVIVPVAVAVAIYVGISAALRSDELRAVFRLLRSLGFRRLRLARRA
ncbi:MAG: murein biosynthesis integral membrane protein MurJ [Chloroflexota bacterium]